MAALIGIIAVVIGSVILASAIMALQGWVLSLLWLWFLVPLGVEPITFLHALGISLLIGLFTSDINRKDENEKDSSVRISVRLATPLIVLLFGWIIHLLM